MPLEQQHTKTKSAIFKMPSQLIIWDIRIEKKKYIYIF